MKKKTMISHTVIHILLIAICIICLVPFVTMVATSLSNVKGTLPDTPILLPEIPLFTENYEYVWFANHFGDYFKNTVLLAILGTILNVMVSICTAYAISRFQFPGKELVFNVFLLTMMIPAQLAIISQFTVMSHLGLVDNYGSVLLLWTSGCVAGNCFFYRSFFESLPKELEESMYLDGASRLQVLVHLIVPLSKPAISTSAIFAFTGYWSDLFTVLTFIKSERKRTLSVALQLFKGQHTTDFGLMFAASVIAVIPIIIVYIVFQKRFMQQGLTDGAVKG